MIIRTHRPFTSGPRPSKVMFIGEAPGREENRKGLPFVGKSGRLQRGLLSHYGVDIDDHYLTNISKTFNVGNPDPTEEEVTYWTPTLLEEIEECEPDLIVAVGRFSAKWLLGQDLKILQIHGVMHEIGAFGPESKFEDLSWITDAKVLPILHPAYGLRNERMKEVVFTDFKAVADAIGKIEDLEELYCPTVDRYPNSVYKDLSGLETKRLLEKIGEKSVVAIDTEFSRVSPWSIQFCFKPGIAYMLRCSREDFSVGIAALYEFFRINDILVVLHNANTPAGCMIDVTKCREMGLDLNEFDIFDTMHDAYLQRTEPGALKSLMWRCAGMKGKGYSETVASVKRQIKYLEKVRDMTLPRPGAFTVIESDGTKKSYRPHSLSARAERFIRNVEDDPLQLKEEDMHKKWNTYTGGGNRQEIKQDLHDELEYAIGPMPEASLEDLPLDEAIEYACKDADATLRVFLHRGGHDAVTRIHLDGTAVLKIFEKMQRNGMPVDPLFFESLIVEINLKLRDLEETVSKDYGDGKPFNPNSNPNVVLLLKKYNIKTKKKTASGEPSTGTPSMEHLRTENKMIDLILQCRELRTKRDKFCKVVLRSRDEDNVVRYRLAINTTSRRPTAYNPNMLGIPTKDRHGWNIRSGFVCPDGYYFAAFDYSQQEMRFMAHESRDETLCRFFKEGRDVHTETACLIFGVSRDELDKETMRRPAKNVNFGMIFGISAYRLANELQAKGLDWKVDRCREFMNSVSRIYPGIGQYKAEVIQSVNRCGYVEDCWGMRRYLPGIWSDDPGVKAAAERQAVNHRIQGGSQGETQRAMIWIEQEMTKRKFVQCYEADWRLEPHDELLFITSIGGVKPLRDLVQDGMVNHCGIKLRVPIVVEGHFAKTWGGVK